jgi:CRP-like cAMP-binding protein
MQCPHRGDPAGRGEPVGQPVLAAVAGSGPAGSGRPRLGGRATPAWPVASLLGRLSEPARAALVDLGAAKTFPAGRQILRQGAPGTHAYLLLAGCVKVTGNESGREPLLAVRVGGDLVGEMAVLSGGTRSATVTTATVTSVRVISGAELRAFFLRHPDAALELACMLSERLRWANERRVDFAALDAGTRVTRVLAALVGVYGRDTGAGRDLGVSLTQEEIASLAGVRLPTAEKVLRALQRAGVVRLGYRKVLVLDVSALHLAADL